MTITILEMPISIKLTFGHQGCCCLFLRPQPPLPSLYCSSVPVAPLLACLAHGPSKDQGEQGGHNCISNVSFAINLAWNGAETPRSFRFPPRLRDLREGGAGRSEISVLRAQAASQTGKAIAAGLLKRHCLIYSAIQQCQYGLGYPNFSLKRCLPRPRRHASTPHISACSHNSQALGCYGQVVHVHGVGPKSNPSQNLPQVQEAARSGRRGCAPSRDRPPREGLK